MTSLTDKQFNELKDLQRDLILASHQDKDKEVSALHREILAKLKDLENKIVSHDVVIKEVSDIFPEIKEAVKAYQKSSIISKAIISVIFGVPALAGFVAGIIYFINLIQER